MFDRFQERLGPLPVWAWGLLVGGVVVGIYYWRQLKDNNGSTVTEDNADAAASESDMTSSRDAIDGAFNAGTASGSTLATTTAPDTTDTNMAWAYRVIQKLIGAGVSPITAQAAIQKYVDGEPLSTAENALVNRGIQLEGSLPPDGVATPQTTATTTAVKIAKWQRLNTGQIVAVMSDGTKVNQTMQAYIDAGMPGFSYNAYEYQTYKIPSNATTVANVATRYNTSPLNIQILNGWKSVPNLKKGQRIKVPAKKGTGK